MGADPCWGPPSRGRILTFGPGAAALAASLAARDATAVACDLGRRGLQAGRGRQGDLCGVLAEPESLPFPAESFDLVVCRDSLHRAPEPAAVVWELVRVCRQEGQILVEEPFCSEHAPRARYHNRLARLRDRSYHQLLSLSGLVALLGAFGLRVRRLRTEDRQREYNEWLRGARTTPLRAQRLYQLLLAAAEGDLAGLDVRLEGETLLFTERFAQLLCERPP